MGLSLKYLAVVLASLPLLTHAQTENCYLQDRTVTKSQAVIAERSRIAREIVPGFGGDKTCVVNYRARIGNEWHMAQGRVTWDGQASEGRACARAITEADNELLQRIGTTQAVNEKVLVCNDRPGMATINSPKVGHVGDVSQFRPHPEKTERFYHSGTQCKWFVESAFAQNRMRQYQGIICETQPSQWVVVDKF